MKPELLHILQHSLGVDKHGQGRRYRNGFVTGPGGNDFNYCQELVAMEMMKDHGPQNISGGMHCFTVTEIGITAMCFHSPPPPKLSRSKERYKAFLISGSGMKFGEWIKRRNA